MMSEIADNTSISRRSFIKTTGATVGGGLLFGGLGSMRNLTIEPAYAAETTEEKITKGACSWSCSFCQYDVIVRDGNIVRLEPQEGHTQRMCLRGRSRLVRMYSEERIKYPMKRAGARGENKWERITWEEAIDTIATKWKKTAEEFGPQANAKYHCAGSQGMMNGNAGMMKRLFNATGCTLLDFSFDMAVAYGMIRAGLSWFDFNEGEDYVNSDYVITWGANPADANIQMWQHVANAQEAGAELIVIDPIFSTTASKADYWVHPYPATDAALCMGISKYLIDEKLCDYAFMRDHSCAPFLIDAQTKGYVRMSALGVEPTVGPISPMTGKPTIVDPVVVWDKATNGPVPVTDAVDPLIENVPDIPGVDVAGTAWEMYVDHVKEWTFEKVQEVTDVPKEDVIKIAEACASGKVTHYINYGQGAYDNGLHAAYATSILAILTGNLGKPGCSVGGFDYVYGAIFGNPVTFPPNGKMMSTISALTACDIQQKGTFLGKPHAGFKNLWITHGNLLTGNTNSNRLKKEFLDAMEMIVVTDIDFTETVRYADIILPVADAYEYEDIVPLSHERNIRLTEKAIDPLYESKKEADIARLVATALGLEDVVNISDEEYWAAAFADAPAKKYGLNIEAMRNNKLMRYVDKKPYVGNEALRFAGEAGRTIFYADKVAPRLPSDQKFDNTFERVPRYFENTEASRTSALKEKYPFIIMSKRNRIRIHSVLYMKCWAHDVNPEPIFFINPSAAKEQGIANEDYIELYNDRGHVVGKAIYSEGVPPEIIMYPKGYQSHECKSGSLSEITTDRFDTCAVNCSFFDNRVALRPWKEGK